MSPEFVDDYQGLLLREHPMIDTRAPVEYAKGSFASAVNLPLMDDTQREAVGIAYKREGPAAAVELGHRLVSGLLREQRVAQWRAFAEQYPDAVIFCFRGGMRSQIVQQWLAEEGIRLPRVRGGYKALRGWVVEELERAGGDDTPGDLLVLGGRTGCGKTDLLQRLPRAIDLEGLANHRGSAFGRLDRAQPTQITFENRLAVALARLTHAGGASGAHTAHKPVILEDESRQIGRLNLPLGLHRRMQASSLVLLEEPIETRVAITAHQYVDGNLRDLLQRFADSHDPHAAALEQLESDLLGAVERIGRRLGGERSARVSSLVRDAFVLHRQGDSSGHGEWIRVLLEEYYDPMYDYQIDRRRERVAFSGDAGQVERWLRDRLA